MLVRFVVRPIRHAYSIRPNFGGFTDIDYWARIQNFNRFVYLSSPQRTNVGTLLNQNNHAKLSSLRKI